MDKPSEKPGSSQGLARVTHRDKLVGIGQDVFCLPSFMPWYTLPAK